MRRFAVVLAGGSGNRLWPASRVDRPKQFLALGADPASSLLAATVRRLGSLEPLVVAGADHMEQVRADLPGLPEEAFLAEPVGRNTAAAIGLAAVHLSHRDPDAVMGVLPADHHIGDPAGFRAVVDRAFEVAAARDVIVTVGIVPTRAATGFGYLEVGATLAGADDVATVTRFVEKPDRATAEQYLRGGRHLWNGGMFFATARRLLAELAAHMPDTHRALIEIGDALKSPGGTAAAAATAARLYPDLPSISIDYGVMEKATGVVALRGDFGWHDVGSWAALADYRPADPDGNVVAATAVLCDAHRNVVVGDPDRVIAVVGVDDLVVVQSGDAVLVIPRQRAEEVRAAVAALAEKDLTRFQ